MPRGTSYPTFIECEAFDREPEASGDGRAALPPASWLPGPTGKDDRWPTAYRPIGAPAGPDPAGTAAGQRPPTGTDV